jgi:AAA domain/Primase C terminal 2 (PriCT-2)/RepB DNA-primase from phage plasmid
MNLTAHSSAVLIPLQTTNQTASTNAPVRDREATRQFLHLLDPTARDFTFQTFAEPNSHNAGLARSTSDRAEVVRLYELGGAGVYVTINETDLTGRKRENIKRIRAIWQEDDDGHGGPFPLEPSVVVESSPQHFHRYWLTADGWPADEQGRADFAAVMERMVTSYGCDKNAKDLSRVLRVPGFLHRKDPARPHMVRIVEDNGRRYTREQILQAFPRVEREQTQRNEWRAADRDEERIADALRAIPADDRDVWLQIGMALKDELGDGGRSIWDNWSSTCREKFKDRDQERTWRSFRRNGIGIGTLFWHAQRHGWLPPRREPPRDKTTGNGAARSNASPDTNRAAVLVRADELNPEAINWAWKNRFAFGKLAVLAGDPGLGKSTMLVEIAALHSIGGEFPCGEGRAQQCESLILTAEDGLRDTLIPRLIAAGADLSKIHFLTGTKAEGSDDESLFDLGRDIPALRKAFKEHPNIRILIIDPLTAYLGPIKAKENSEVRRVLAPLVKLIEETSVLAVGNNHLNKSAGKALYRVLDSIAFVAVGRIVHLVIKDADNPDNRKLICDKTNIGSRPLGLTYIIQKVWIEDTETKEQIETSRICWGTQHIDQSADEALEEPSEPTHKDDAIDFLRQVLADGPMSVADIEAEARGAGVLAESQRISQSKPFRSARETLGIVPKKSSMAGGWVWALPSS